jgi:biopolymer transport protein ExbB/TolQ
MDLLTKGGVFMLPILMVSIGALALIIERVYTLWLRYRLDEEGFVKGLMHALDEQDFAGALEECARAENNPLSRVLRAGLLKVHRSDKEIERAMEEEMLRTAPTIRKRIGYLATLGNVATLLGLLGTIFGLIQAFEGVSMADPATKQEILARGISIAMLTTAFGLIVAIPCLLSHAFLQNKSMQMIEGLEEKAFTLFNKISALHRDIEKKDVRLKMKSIEGGRRA